MTQNRLRMLTGLLMLLSAFSFSIRADNSFEAPDFAFPRTVEANARVELAKSLRESDYPDVLRAVLQICVASNGISTENLGPNLNLLDSVGQLMPRPYSGVAKLIQAQMLIQAFQSNYRKFSNRVLPSDSLPADPMLWSKDLFAMRVSALCREALEEAGEMQRIPITRLQPILQKLNEPQVTLYPTLFDLAAYKAVSMLNVFREGAQETIPFNVSGNTPKGISSLCRSQKEEILEALARFHQDSPEQLPWALARETQINGLGLSEDEIYARAEELWQRCSGSQASLLVLSDFSNSYTSPARADLWYARAQKALERFPDGIYANAVRNRLETLSAKKFSANCRSQYLSTDSIEVECKLENTNASYLLLCRIPFDLKRVNRAAVTEKGKVVQTLRIVSDSIVPFEEKKRVAFPNPGYGRYLLLGSETPDFQGLFGTDGLDAAGFIVSDMMILTSQDHDSTDQDRLYVVSAKDMNPVSGAKVVLTPDNSRNGAAATRTTGAEGWVPLGKGGYSADVTCGKDRISSSYYFYEWRRSAQKSRRANVFTDLALYHPGDSAALAVVCYDIDDKALSLARNASIKAVLQNVNGESVDTLALVTDDFGRCRGAFRIPADGVAGRYNIMIRGENGVIGSESFQVADYVAPTFFVEMDSREMQCKAGDTLILKGKALTYSGMPVANAAVAYQISYRNFLWWWRPQNSGATYGGETRTGPDGCFTIELDTRALEGSEYELGCFSLVATVTSEAGESQESAPLQFSLGNAYEVRPAFPEQMEITSDKITLTATVKNITGTTENRPVEYSIRNSKGEETASGVFVSPYLYLDASLFPSGKYKVELRVQGNPEDALPVEQDVVFYRPTDTCPPVATPLWVPVRRIVAPSGAKEVQLTVGSSYPSSHILCEVSGQKGFVERRWLEVDAANRNVSVPAPGDDERFTVSLYGVHSLDASSATVSVVPSASTRKMEMETVTFRDRITPGSRESWSFRLKKDGALARGVPALAVMSDKALNAVTPFVWSFSPRGSIFWENPCNGDFITLPHTDYASWQVARGAKYYTLPDVGLPEWDTYGYTLYGSHSRAFGARYAYSSRSAKEMAECDGAFVVESAMACDDAAAANGVMEEYRAEDLGASMETETPGNGDAGEIPLREASHPLAFFYPTLLSDGEGEVKIEFEVPDFNTTWQLQVMAYDEELFTAYRCLDAVAAKKVMVQGNAPRFLRTGDKAVIRATLMNNTEEPLEVSGRIELYDPLTSRVLAQVESAPAILPAKGSRVAALEYDVPSDIQMIGMRAYASGDGHSDGEQTLIPVLPSSSPVTESEQFYLGGSLRSVSLALPEYPGDARLAFTYCNNPVWLCLTALPSLDLPSSESVLAKSSSLLVNALASGLTRRYPQAGEAIRYWSASPDGTLVSNLQKNDDLKVLSLDRTVWVQDAQGETLRMAGLARLLDRGNCDTQISSLVNDLSRAQHADGSWSWCPGMKGSEYITECVLSRIASLHRLGMVPDDPRIAEMAKKGVQYCDKSLYSDYEAARKTFSTAGMLRYLFVRSQFPGVKPSKGFSLLKAAALKAVRNEWRVMDVEDCALAAMVLHAEGYPQEARTILESLRQRAVSKPGRGTWYDNLRSGWNGSGRLGATTRVLEAFSAIAPRDTMVDGLRQWLILQKQTLDWGNDAGAAETVCAILGSGTDWTGADSAPVVSIGEKSLEIPESNRYTGEFSLFFSGEELSGKTLRISREGSQPSWGGVIARYISPIMDVKAHTSGDLTVSKRVLKVDATPEGTVVSGSGELKAGDRIRVELTLTTPRDLQYVAVTDERAAALQPVEQLSGYTSTDNVWYYREVGNSQTNLMIEFLPKGSHIIYYECFVSQEGEYSLGIATAQSLYAPVISGNSKGELLKVY